MKRLTTNCPDNNLDAALNLFYVKDFETWVRGGGDGPDYPDIRLYDFIRKAAKILLPDLDFPMDDDGVDYAMGELLLDGPDEPTGLLALLYTAAWSYAELRGRLMQYEDTELTPGEIDMDHEAAETLRQLCRGYDLGRLVNLAEADKSGCVVVRPYRIDAAVYVLVKDEAVFYPETNGWYIGKETIGAITQDGFYLGDPEEGSFEPNDEIGKTVFLTYEEAAQALEGRNG